MKLGDGVKGERGRGKDGGFADLTVRSLFQQAMTFDPNFFLFYACFVCGHVCNENDKKAQFRRFIIV